MGRRSKRADGLPSNGAQVHPEQRRIPEHHRVPNQRRRVQRRDRVQSCAVAWTSGIPRAVAGTCPTIGSTAPDFSSVSSKYRTDIPFRPVSCGSVSTGRAPPRSPPLTPRLLAAACKRGSGRLPLQATACPRKGTACPGNDSDAWGTSARHGVRRRPIEGWRSRL